MGLSLCDGGGGWGGIFGCVNGICGIGKLCSCGFGSQDMVPGVDGI